MATWAYSQESVDNPAAFFTSHFSKYVIWIKIHALHLQEILVLCKKKRKKKKSIDSSRCALTNAWGYLYTGFHTEEPFKKKYLYLGILTTSYDGSLMDMQHPSQQEVGSFTQGALRLQEYTFCCSPWKSLGHLLHTLLSELLSQLGSAVGPSTKGSKCRAWPNHNLQFHPGYLWFQRLETRTTHLSMPKCQGGECVGVERKTGCRIHGDDDEEEGVVWSQAEGNTEM